MDARPLSDNLPRYYKAIRYANRLGNALVDYRDNKGKFYEDFFYRRVRRLIKLGVKNSCLHYTHIGLVMDPSLVYPHDVVKRENEIKEYLDTYITYYFTRGYYSRCVTESLLLMHQVIIDGNERDCSIQELLQMFKKAPEAELK